MPETFKYQPHCFRFYAEGHKKTHNLKVKVVLRLFLPLIESPDLYSFTIVHDSVLFIESDQQ